MVIRSIYLACLPIATGVLLALAMPPADWYWLVWIALVPIGLAMTEKQGQVELYLGAFAAGAIFQWIHCDWMRTVTVGATLSYGRVGQWIAQGLAFALPWPLMLWAGRALARKTAWRAVVILPAVWVAFEYVRWYGGCLLDLTGFPWGQLGLALGDCPRVAQVASLAGVYGVGAVVAATNGAVLDALRGRGFGRSLLTAVLILGAAVAFGEWQLRHEFAGGPTVCLMPERAEPTDVEPTADIVLWSEGSCINIADDSDETKLAAYQKRADDAGVILVTGCTRKQHGDAFNSVAAFVPGRSFQGFYDKVRIVPFSEYHPPHMPRLNDDTKSRFAHGDRYPVFELGKWRAAALICYDVCFPSTAREFMLSDKPPDFFVVPSYEAHDISGCVRLATLRHARFRAIECRRAIVRNVVGGVSGIIDGNGRLLSELDSIGSPTVAGRVPLDDRTSLYTRFGDWLPRGSLLLIAIMFFLRGWRGIGKESRQPSTQPAP